MKNLTKVCVFVLLLAAVLVACGPTSQQIRQGEINANAPEVYHVTKFVERNNINRRQQVFDDPAQVSWIYCLADNGQVVFYGPVEGKVTSSGKRLEPIHSATSAMVGDIYTDELVQQDGTFGGSDSYVYWFDPDGNYYQWDGYYFLTSVPIKVNESVLNIRNVQP